MEIFPEYERYDGLGLAQLIQNGEITPSELLEVAIQRIEKKNPVLNAVIYKMYDQARIALDAPLADGLFKGVPFLLKDILADYQGVPMQCGSRLMRGYVSRSDSELVKRYKQAGLVIVGKTNVPEFGLSPVTEPELFGPTLNPWDLTRNAGGSSGGAAAAVASGMVPMAHGGDGGGSIRIPASYCGLFGLKPSRGRTPAGPLLMRIWQGMVVEHAITRSVRDSAALLDVTSFPELGSPISLPQPDETYLSCLGKALPPLRIAYCEQPFFSSTSRHHPEYLAALKQGAYLCEALGHRVEAVTFSIASDETALAFLIVIAAEMASSIQWMAKIFKQSPEYSLLEPATAVLCEMGEHFSAQDFSWAIYVLDQVGRQVAEFFTQYDILLNLTMTAPPPFLGEFRPSRLEKNILELLRRIPYGPILKRLTKRTIRKYCDFTPYTPLSNITGQPAMTVPLYWDSLGLPIGIHFAARLGEEKILFQLAHQLEEAQPWAGKRPMYSPNVA